MVPGGTETHDYLAGGNQKAVHDSQDMRRIMKVLKSVNRKDQIRSPLCRCPKLTNVTHPGRLGMGTGNLQNSSRISSPMTLSAPIFASSIASCPSAQPKSITVLPAALPTRSLPRSISSFDFPLKVSPEHTVGSCGKNAFKKWYWQAVSKSNCPGRSGISGRLTAWSEPSGCSPPRPGFYHVLP